LHRIFQAPIAVHEFAHGGALGAMRAAVDRRIPTGLLADPHAVRNFGHHRAADPAMRADVLSDGVLLARGRPMTRLRLALARQPQRTECSGTAGDEAGAAQESATIERAIRRALQGAGERTAAGVTFRSLDQHGSLPQLGYRLTR